MSDEKPRTYEFRITCLLAGGTFMTEERVLSVELPGFSRPITIILPDKKRPGDDTITFLSGGFPSEETARAAGEPLKTAVALAGVANGIGIDVGNDQPPSFLRWTAGGKSDDCVQTTVHGLQVVPEIENMVFVWGGRVRIETKIQPDVFQTQLARAFGLGKPLTKKQALAGQLYNQSHFQSSGAARFLTLVSAVEALTVIRPMSATAVKLVDGFLKRSAKSRVAVAQKEDLINRLGHLKRESIGLACRDLMAKYCGDAGAQEFKNAYSIRSRLLHNGEPPKGTDLSEEARKLDPMVRQLVIGHILGRPAKRAAPPKAKRTPARNRGSAKK